MGARCEVSYEKFGEPHVGAWKENDTGPGWSFLVPASDPVIRFQAGTILKKFVVAITHEHALIWGQPESKTERSAPVTVEFVEAVEWDDGLFRIQLAKNPVLCEECDERTAEAAGICGGCEGSNQPEDFSEGWKHGD